MNEVMPTVLTWMANNWAWILVVLGLIFEWTPVIKINPISALFKWIGKKANQPVNDRLDKIDERFEQMENHLNEIDDRLNKQEEQIDNQRIANIRSLILDFANSCRNGVQHSHEEFVHVLDENGVYEKLVKKHNIINSVYKESYSYILEKYKQCMNDNSFLR